MTDVVAFTITSRDGDSSITLDMGQIPIPDFREKLGGFYLDGFHVIGDQVWIDLSEVDDPMTTTTLVVSSKILLVGLYGTRSPDYLG